VARPEMRDPGWPRSAGQVRKGQPLTKRTRRIRCSLRPEAGMFLEPITAVVAALSSGATFVLKGVATEAIKSAYAALKTHIQKQHPAADLSVAQLELQPASKSRQTVLSEDLESAGASADLELVQLAQAVVVLIQQSPEVARSIGVDVGELDQANVTFGNVAAGKNATGVKITKVVGGTLQFGDVTASAESTQKKP
jgi:hypothetical protein